ncbi:MAG: CCA tRNA nucleotidyltransferase [Clostridia bacterium]|nr:CCA tRNA nucleotidyltransferase [Clostridia bacterium]
MEIKYPDFVGDVLSVLEKNGHEGYIVGGSLRDMILGREPNDFDVTTSALPEKVCEMFRADGYSVIETGIKHGTVTVMCGKEPVEVTTFRFDGEYKDSRHPEKVTFTRNIADDLSRRDFTVNAIAYNPQKGIIDLFGGESDIETRVIRCVGDPEKRFEEDALRILRAFRFVSKLDFEIDRETLRGAEKMRFGLQKVSRERIFAEISGLLEGKSAGKALELMMETGVLPVIFEGYERLPSEIDRLSPILSLRLAALFWDAPVNLRGEWINSLKMSNELKAQVQKLLETRNVRPEISLYGARRFLVRYGELSSAALELLSLADFALSDFEPLLREAENEDFPRSIKELAVNGGDLISVGFKAGQEIGDLLEELFDAVLRDPSLNDKEKLLEMTKLHKGLS